MAKPYGYRPPPTGRTNLASCVVATIFLIFLVIVALIVYFTVFKPEDPRISVTAVNLPSFAAANDTVSFTFVEYLSVHNHNHGAFAHYDSSVQILHAGEQLGFMFVPAGQIPPGGARRLSATFSVGSFSLGGGGGPREAAGLDLGLRPGLPVAENRVGPTMELETRMRMPGRVRVLELFSHHVEARSDCRVTIAVSDGTVKGFHC